MAARASTLQLAVCGLHLRGQPLNWQLTDLQSKFVRECKSAPEYRHVHTRGGRRRCLRRCGDRLACVSASWLIQVEP